MNILAFKVKKNEINISSFDHFTDRPIFLSMHVELITYPIHMQMSSKSIVLHVQNIADSTDINFKHFFQKVTKFWCDTEVATFSLNKARRIWSLLRMSGMHVDFTISLAQCPVADHLFDGLNFLAN